MTDPLQASPIARTRQITPKRGVLFTDGWGGRQRQPVIIEGETPKRYRVRAVNQELRLPRGRGVLKVLRSGTVLVPKYAVVVQEESSDE